MFDLLITLQPIWATKLSDLPAGGVDVALDFNAFLEGVVRLLEERDRSNMSNGDVPLGTFIYGNEGTFPGCGLYTTSETLGESGMFLSALSTL